LLAASSAVTNLKDFCISELFFNYSFAW